MAPYRLVEAIARLDALQRERLDWLEVAPGTEAPSVVCRPHPYCGEPFGGQLAGVPDLGSQVEELAGSGLLGTVAVDRPGDGVFRLRLWSTPRERRAWEARVQLSLHYPAAADLLRAAGELKVTNWRREQALERLHEAVWAADLLDGVAATDLIDTAQVARATFYKFTKDRPEDWQPPPPPLPPPSLPRVPRAFLLSGALPALVREPRTTPSPAPCPPVGMPRIRRPGERMLGVRMSARCPLPMRCPLLMRCPPA